MTGPDFRATLAALGMSQTRFAERYRLDTGTVNRWCNGRQPIPGWAVAILDDLRERREIAERLAR